MALRNGLFGQLVDRLGGLANRWAPAERIVNRLAINNLINHVPARPHPLSTGWDYPNWDGLTNRAYSSRHLPPADAGYIASLPDLEKVAVLFRRAEGQGRRSEKTSSLFPHFAQWFTDGFLRTNRLDSLFNTSNHEIDISPLYGRTKVASDLLRAGETRGHNQWIGGGGCLKSQTIDGGEFPPYFFRQSTFFDVLKKHGPLDPNHDNTDLSASDRADLLARWRALLEDLVEPEFSPLIPEFWLLRAERDLLMHSPERIKNRFAMGVERANNQFGYVSFNVLFLREHNRLCRVLAVAHPDWDGERLFQIARNTVIAMLLKIVIEEYINHIAQSGFKFKADPTSFYAEPWYRTNWMTVEFNLLYRWHSLMPDHVTVGGTTLPIEQIVFHNAILTNEGLATVMDALSRAPAYELGLFNTPPALVEWAEKTSIRLGREIRLRPYNDYREYASLSRARTFEEISSSPRVQTALRELYGTPDRVEYVVGLFAEDVKSDGVLPELITTLVAVDAFSQALTNPLLSKHVWGHPDTFAEGRDELERTTCLRDIVLRNVPEYTGNKSALRVELSLNAS